MRPVLSQKFHEMKSDTKNILLLIFLLIFLLKGIFYAGYVTPLTVGATPDDIGHLTNIMYISSYGEFPVLRQTYTEERLAAMWHSGRGDRILLANGMQLFDGELVQSQENHWIAQHPPLYYLLATALYKPLLLFTHSFVKILFILRCQNLIFGLLSLLCIDKLLRFFDTGITAYTCILLSFVFSTQIQFTFSSVSNDPLLIFLCLAGLFYLLKYSRDSKALYYYMLVVICILIVLTKYTGGLVIVCYAGYFLYLSLNNHGFKKSLPLYIKGGLLAFAVILPLFLRNFILYGILMPTNDFMPEEGQTLKNYLPTISNFVSRSGYPQEITEHLLSLIGWGRFVRFSIPEISLFSLVLFFCAFVYCRQFIVSYKAALFTATMSAVFLLFAGSFLNVSMPVAIIILSSLMITAMLVYSNKYAPNGIHIFFLISMYFVYFSFFQSQYMIFQKRGTTGAMHGRYYLIIIFPFLYLLFHCFDVLEKKGVRWVKAVPLCLFAINFFIESSMIYEAISIWSYN